MDSGKELSAELLQLRGDVGASLGQAVRKLAAGLDRMLTSHPSLKHLSAATYKLRWRWQDELARIMRQYANQLSRLGKQHQIPELADWLAAELRNQFPVLVEQELRGKFDPRFGPYGELRSVRSRRRAMGFGENGELDVVFSRSRSSRLRGELILYCGERQIRVPVVVSTQVRFLESKLLDHIDLSLPRSQRTTRSIPDLDRSPSWTFQKHRHGWSVGSHQSSTDLPDLLGMTYLQTLLRAPGREIPVELLVEAARGPSLTAAPVHDPDFADLGIGGIGQEILDEQAKREYKRQIEQLKRDAEIATELADTKRIAEITEELEFLRGELKRTTALYGRPRRFAGSQDNLRVSVRKSAAKAIDTISQRIPEVGEHLKASISFGFKCCYRPLQNRDWRF